MFLKENILPGLDAMYRYESYDNRINPTRGMLFELNLGGKINTSEYFQAIRLFQALYGILQCPHP